MQDQVFCLTEERDYFQGKFLEQVSEIAALKDQLGRSRKEIDRLRMELMSRGVQVGNEDGSLDIARDSLSSPSSSPRHHVRTPTSDKETRRAYSQQKPNNTAASSEEEKKDDTSELTTEVDSGGEEEDDECDEQEQEKDDEDKAADEIRQSAEKLLQWASYRSLARTSTSTPEHLSVASPRSSSSILRQRPSSLLEGGIPSSVQLDAAVSPSSKSKDTAEDDDDDQTYSSTASSNSGTRSAEEHGVEKHTEPSPIRPGTKMLEKFEKLVTSL